MQNQEQARMWGGRFEKAPAPEAEAFSHSLPVDIRLWRQDIQVSLTYARMLGIRGIISPQEANLLVEGLLEIAHEIEKGLWQPDPGAEDIHTAIESRLYEKVGALAGKLHTARSRNDQVATDTRLYLKQSIQTLASNLIGLVQTLIDLAKQHTETLMPGLTHQQHAQPVSLAHHLLAHAWALMRDLERLADNLLRVKVCPLGSGALAGVSFPIDRELLANELELDEPAPNSMDAVSDRDFVAEHLFVCALLMVHLSRLAQELILWSTPEYGYIELDDAYTTGSSLMPQKKNPDIAELIRGRSALAIGNLTAMLALLKGLPLTYHRDLQDDKTLLFSTNDIVIPAVRLMQQMLETAHWHMERMREAVRGDFSTATELADYLVRKGVPVREAHHLVGQIVRDCLQGGKTLETLTLSDLKHYSPMFEADALQAVQPEAALHARTSFGGTAPEAVQEQIELATERLNYLHLLLSQLLH
ncbi:MAG: argininosuccinate lyase [Fimbriimonadales bacterium]|nr:argininosuccinate lyase [Fimbriimonadales bacterium]